MLEHNTVTALNSVPSLYNCKVSLLCRTSSIDSKPLQHSALDLTVDRPIYTTTSPYVHPGISSCLPTTAVRKHLTLPVRALPQTDLYHPFRNRRRRRRRRQRLSLPYPSLAASVTCTAIIHHISEHSPPSLVRGSEQRMSRNLQQSRGLPSPRRLSVTKVWAGP